MNIWVTIGVAHTKASSISVNLMQAETSTYGKGANKQRDNWTPHPRGAKPKDVMDIPTTCNGMGENLTGIGWLAILTRSTTNGQLKGLQAFGV
jgi:hypothetical protein